MSLLIDPEVCDFYAVEAQVVGALKEGLARARTRTGLVLQADDQVVWAEKTAYHPARGRSSHRSARTSYTEHSLAYFADMLIHLQRLDEGSAPGPECFLRNRFDVITISDADRDARASLVALATATGAIPMLWVSRDAAVRVPLWNRLLDHAAFDRGVALHRFEDGELPLSRDGFLKSDVPNLEGYDGQFVNDGERLVPDVAHREFVFATGITGSDDRLLHGLSPLQRALNAAERSSTLRISKQDNKEREARFELPDPEWQWPDLLRVEEKVSNYCLAREGKREGFESAGFHRNRDRDALRIAAALCSGLLTEFEAKDARINADGTLQFASSVVIAATNGRLCTVECAWFSSPKGIALSTAYMRAPDPSGSALQMRPSAGSQEDALRRLLEDADQFGKLHRTYSSRGGARVFVEHAAEGLQAVRHLRALARSSGRFTRARLGGRCELVAFGKSSTWMQAAAASSYASIALGLLGIRSLPAPWVD